MWFGTELNYKQNRIKNSETDDYMYFHLICQRKKRYCMYRKERFIFSVNGDEFNIAIQRKSTLVSTSPHKQKSILGRLLKCNLLLKEEC